jgi:tetratricopeptide (TPR) repeat protein
MSRTRWLYVGLIILALISIAGCASPAEVVVSETSTSPRPTEAPLGTAVPPKTAAPPTQPSGDAATHITAGRAAMAAGDLSKAEQEYMDALALDPNSAQAQFSLGNLYVRSNRLAEAEKAFLAALASDPKMATAQANLGVVYYELGQFPQAASAFEAVLKAEPSDAATMYLLAAVRLQEENLPEAEKLLLAARDIKPDLPEVYYGLGVLYRLKGQKEDAIQAFEKFLAIGPGQDPTAMDFARKELEQLKGQ